MVLLKSWIHLSVPCVESCLVPTKQDSTQGLFYNRGLGEGDVAHKLKLMPCWSVLDIGSLSAMWTMLAFAKSPGT